MFRGIHVKSNLSELVFSTVLTALARWLEVLLRTELVRLTLFQSGRLSSSSVVELQSFGLLDSLALARQHYLRRVVQPTRQSRPRRGSQTRSRWSSQQNHQMVSNQGSTS